MPEEEKTARGRRENRAPTEKVTMPVDPATLRMLDALATYGRFGVTVPDVALSIIRLWLWENEARLGVSVQGLSRPFGLDPDVPGPG
jgi:hypothetical protein